MNSYIIAIALLATHLGCMLAASDCSISPGDFIKSLGQCCRQPKMNLSAFSRQCINLADSFKSSNLEIIECLFKTFDVIKGEEVQMDNARKLANMLYPSDPEFAKAVAVCFDKCQPIVKARTAKIRSRRPLVSTPQSSVVSSKMILIGYLTCIGSQLLLNCPSSFWIPSNKCEKSKEYMTNCQSMMGTGNSAFRDGRLRWRT